jgi:hypothetical protein
MAFMTNQSFTKPVILYGSNISYFTGKMENYFRVKNIPYELKSMQFPAFEKRMKNEVGLQQMPAVELPDGRWMTDTTKMIQWLNHNNLKTNSRPMILYRHLFAFYLKIGLTSGGGDQPCIIGGITLKGLSLHLDI